MLNPSVSHWKLCHSSWLFMVLNGWTFWSTHLVAWLHHSQGDSSTHSAPWKQGLGSWPFFLVAIFLSSCICGYFFWHDWNSCFGFSLDEYFCKETLVSLIVLALGFSTLGGCQAARQSELVTFLHFQSRFFSSSYLSDFDWSSPRADHHHDEVFGHRRSLYGWCHHDARGGVHCWIQLWTLDISMAIGLRIGCNWWLMFDTSDLIL